MHFLRSLSKADLKHLLLRRLRRVRVSHSLMSNTCIRHPLLRRVRRLRVSRRPMYTVGQRQFLLSNASLKHPLPRRARRLRVSHSLMSSAGLKHLLLRRVRRLRASCRPMCKRVLYVAFPSNMTFNPSLLRTPVSPAPGLLYIHHD